MLQEENYIDVEKLDRITAIVEELNTIKDQLAILREQYEKKTTMLKELLSSEATISVKKHDDSILHIAEELELSTKACNILIRATQWHHIYTINDLSMMEQKEFKNMLKDMRYCGEKTTAEIIAKFHAHGIKFKDEE